MIMRTTRYTLGLCVMTALGLCSVKPVSAAPVLSNTAGLKSATENLIAEVRYVRRGVARRGVARAAVATGVGVAAAASYRYAAGYPNYGYGTTYNYGYAPYSNYGYAPSSQSYNYGYAPYTGTYGYNYSYTSGYYGYGVRRAARGVARRVAYRR
jgi:hypothetical protein